MSKPRMAVYQGTFDPFTSGHLSVVKNILSVFDEVLILLLVNPVKTPLFSVQERAQMIAEATASFPGVYVESYEGLLADYMKKHGLTVCVRGVRNAQDSAYEQENHFLSRTYYPALQTLLLPCETQWQHLSSSAVKAACSAGRLPREWVPAPVADKLQEKYPNLQIL